MVLPVGVRDVRGEPVPQIVEDPPARFVGQVVVAVDGFDVPGRFPR